MDLTEAIKLDDNDKIYSVLGIEPSGKFYRTCPLVECYTQGRVDLVKLLLEKGADPEDCADYPEDYGITVLMLAAEKCDMDMVKMMAPLMHDQLVFDLTVLIVQEN